MAKVVGGIVDHICLGALTDHRVQDGTDALSMSTVLVSCTGRLISVSVMNAEKKRQKI